MQKMDERGKRRKREGMNISISYGNCEFYYLHRQIAGEKSTKGKLLFHTTLCFPFLTLSYSLSLSLSLCKSAQMK